MQIRLRSDVDVVRARCAAAQLSRTLGLSSRMGARLDLVIAELATNAVRHAGSGTVALDLTECPRPGIVVSCRDHGPGIHVTKAPSPGAKRGLGLGLSVVEELADVLTIDSADGRGSSIEAVIWT